MIFACNISCCNINFTNISKRITVKQTRSFSRVKNNRFHEVRLALHKVRKINFSTVDTLYLLESYNIETAEFYGRFWSNTDTINYVYLNGLFNFEKNKLFTSYMIKLVSNWDIHTIRLEEKYNSNMLPAHQIYATCVIIKSNQVKIQSISFKDFFKLGRDNE